MTWKTKTPTSEASSELCEESVYPNMIYSVEKHFLFDHNNNLTQNISRDILLNHPLSEAQDN